MSEKKGKYTEIIPSLYRDCTQKLYKSFLSLFLWLVPVAWATWEAETGEAFKNAL